MINLIYTSGQNHHNILVNKNDNKLYSFGMNQYGQLGLGDNIDRTIPTLIDFEFDVNPICI
jgi:alpha-tubulin suppressor-like RCC1 family protein